MRTPSTAIRVAKWLVVAVAVNFGAAYLCLAALSAED